MNRSRPSLSRTLTAAYLLSICWLSAASRQPGESLPHPTSEIPHYFHLPDAQQQCPLARDDKSGSDPEDWLPWTHKPYCFESLTGLEKHPKFCTLSNINYGAHGISLVTLPHVGASTQTLLDEEPLSLFLRPDQIKDWDTRELPYEVKDIPGKGKGLVATRLIDRYETFMIDRPVIIADISISDTEGTARMHQQLLLNRAADQLVDPNIVRNLSCDSKYAQGEDVIEDVFVTNAFHTEDRFGVQHSALFPHIARINHDCQPNSFIMFSPAGLIISVRSYRTIQPGEEITISYVPVGKISTQRHRELDRWGFTCTCSLCTSPTLSASDARRLRIEKGRKGIDEAIEKGDADTVLELSHEVLELLRREQLRAMSPEVCVLLAHTYLAIGDKEGAKRYGKMAVGSLRDHGFLPPRKEGEEDWSLETLLAHFGAG